MKRWASVVGVCAVAAGSSGEATPVRTTSIVELDPQPSAAVALGRALDGTLTPERVAKIFDAPLQASDSDRWWRVTLPKASGGEVSIEISAREQGLDVAIHRSELMFRQVTAIFGSKYVSARLANSNPNPIAQVSRLDLRYPHPER